MDSFRVSAPGKVILVGEHSVVYGKTAFAASLGQRTTSTFTRSNSSDINLILPLANINQLFDVTQLNDQITDLKIPLKTDLTSDLSTFNLETPHLIDADALIEQVRSNVSKYKPSDHSQECALVAFMFLLEGMFSSVDLRLDSFELLVDSELVVGAGTGSSASYGVCLAATIYQYVKIQASRRSALGTDVSRSGFKPFFMNANTSTFSEDELRVILGWALHSDRVMHGNPSGIDATVILHGNLLEFRRGEEARIERHDTMTLKILLVNSKVTRNTASLVRGVALLKERLPKVVGPVLEAMDGVALTVKQVFAELQALQVSRQPDEKREDQLIDELGTLIDVNQNLLRSLGVSHRTLDDICDVASRHGLSAKLTGAGGGGYAIVLLPPRLEHSKIEALQDEMRKCGYDAILTLIGGQGLKLHVK